MYFMNEQFVEKENYLPSLVEAVIQQPLIILRCMEFYRRRLFERIGSFQREGILVVFKELLHIDIKIDNYEVLSGSSTTESFVCAEIIVSEYVLFLR